MKNKIITFGIVAVITSFIVFPISVNAETILNTQTQQISQQETMRQLVLKLIELLTQKIAELQKQLAEQQAKQSAQADKIKELESIPPTIIIQNTAPQQSTTTPTTQQQEVQKWAATNDWFKQNTWTDCNCEKKTLRIGISKLARIINNENGTASLSIDGKTLNPAILGSPTSYNAIFILENADSTREYDYTVTFNSDLSQGTYTGKAKMNCPAQ